MSFREVKIFTEVIRTLGCPYSVGIDSFNTPDFGLMADLLLWLANLYETDVVILQDIKSEAGRVDFVRSIVQQIAIKSGIRLNPRRLYASDRFAVREMLKIATPIYEGLYSTTSPAKSAKLTRSLPESTKKIPLLSASIPKKSVDLFDGLDKEILIRESRNKVLSSIPPLHEMENYVHSAVDSAVTRLDTLTSELDRLSQDEEALRSKIKQRKHELDRQTKRLLSVKTIRPAFMDEFELHEQELAQLFQVHFQHYRNVDYLEHQIQIEEGKSQERVHQTEQTLGKLKKKATKNVIESMRQQRFDILEDVYQNENDEIIGEDESLDNGF